MDSASAHIQAIFAAQQAHRAVMRQATVAQRQAILRRLAAAVQGAREELLEALASDLGKSRFEANLTEVQQVLAEIEQCIRGLPRWAKARRVASPQAQPGARSEVRHEPRGTVLILGPWNYPVNNLLIPFVDALAAGNTVMLKPSEQASATSRAIARLMARTFEPQLVAVIEGGAEVARELCALPFDHIFFTGSGAVGREVLRQAAPNLVSVSLELGGKTPVLIHESADLQLAAERVAWGKLLNAGQTCMAPDYALIHAGQRDEFVRRLRAIITQRYGEGHWLRTGPDYGRIINERSVARLRELIEGSVQAGATLEMGGECDEQGRFVAPTILSNVQADMPCMTQEIFGPVLPILTYNTLHEAEQFIAQLDTPLALYVFARDLAAARGIVSRVRSGGAAINGCITQNSNLHLPFGGLGPSGMGQYHGEFGFQTFSHLRGVLTEPRLSAVKLTYPPYDRPAARLAGWFLRQLEP